MAATNRTPVHERPRSPEQDAWLRKRYPEMARGAAFPDPPLSRIKLNFARAYANWELAIPNEDIAARTAGNVQNERGWTIRYRFGRNDGSDFMDVYAAHRLTNDRLTRYHEDGSVESLGESLDVMANMDDQSRAEEALFHQRVYELGLEG